MSNAAKKVKMIKTIFVLFFNLGWILQTLDCPGIDQRSTLICRPLWRLAQFDVVLCEHKAS